jgi:pyruvate kinase
VITATQMLETITRPSTPTWAEVSDVAHARRDGTDALMLAGETFVGNPPVEAVQFMARIVSQTETSLHTGGFQELPARIGPTNAEIPAVVAYQVAGEAKAAASVVLTAAGSNARLEWRFRPAVPVNRINPRESVGRQWMVHDAVKPILASDVSSTDEILAPWSAPQAHVATSDLATGAFSWPASQSAVPRLPI